jgi:hypothetical protein
MTTRALLFLFCLVPMTFLATVSFAQDGKPYTPREYPRSELIDFGTYDSPPLEFDFEMIDVKQQPEDTHVNFVMTLNADYATVVNYFKDAYTNQTPAARIAPGIMPFQTARELVVVGHTSVDPTAQAGFTLSGKEMTRRFTIEVNDDAGKTILTMKNIVMSRLFSGVVPARTGFKPAGAKPVGLLYN